MNMIEVYDVRYSQNGGPDDGGPAIATFWTRDDAARCARHCGDLVVVAIDVSMDTANFICE